MEENYTVQGQLRNMTGIYLTRKDKMLLLYRQGSKVVNNMWIASAGGHFEENELNNARACVLRELQEELSITEDMLENLCMRYVVLRNVKGEIRQNYYFFADLKEDSKDDFSSGEGILKWFSIDELSSLEMPFSAKFAIEHYINEGRYTNCLYGGVADGEKVVFTEMRE